MAGGDIITLDIGVRMGVVRAVPGDRAPTSYAILLKRPGEPADVALANLIAFLDGVFRADRPMHVIKEAPLHLGAFAKDRNAEHTVRLTHALHGMVEAMCRRYRIPWTEKAVATIRAHFVGQGNLKRAIAKKLTVDRCILLKYLPPDKRDEDRADALATFDWASNVLFRKAPATLHMFPPKTEPKRRRRVAA